MVFYIASMTYQNIIATAVRESEMLLYGMECSNNFLIKKYVNENYTLFSNPSLECFVLDITALEFIEEEVMQTLDSIRVMNDKLRIILLAANRFYGDEFLKKCARIGIYNIIVSDDFNEIKEELLFCLKEGKQYKDALKFLDYQAEENVVVKTEIKQTVNKVVLGIAGSQERIGTTHFTIMLAAYLRKRGYMVAVVEYNQNPALQAAGDYLGCKFFPEEGSFNYEGVDYYPDGEETKLAGVIGKCYNFILVDFGDFSTCDLVSYNKSDVRFILAGAKPWEVEHVNHIFETVTKETFFGYNYIFNFTNEKERTEIREGMDVIEKVYFLEYESNPFAYHDMPDMEEILGAYMPVKINQEKKKKGFFKKHEKKETGKELAVLKV